jgi:aspartate/methionine/tyrosine aminotransferase
MSNDMLMLRGEAPGTFNLAVGEPVFLQYVYNLTAPRPLEHRKLRYPPFMGEAELIKTLKRYHGGMYQHIVVTNGAKQALLAAFYTYAKLTGSIVVSHRPPYWPSYPTLAKLSGMEFVTRELLTSGQAFRTIHVNTTPNNPDGSERLDSCDVWDAAYAHAVYGNAGSPNHHVSVWSAAKMFGMSGIRVGWLATNDEGFAKKAAEYVEVTTSGVSTDAQARLNYVVESFVEVDLSNYYHLARQELITNGKTVLRNTESFLDEAHGATVDNKGMFAWVRARDPEKFDWALEQSNVKVIPGKACGDDYGWYRINCGHTTWYTRDAMEALRKALRS